MCKPDQLAFGFPVTSLADFYGWLMLKATIMFELEGLKPRFSFFMENCLFVCGSPQYMDNAIKSVLYYRLMTSTAALQLCVSAF